MNDFGLQDLGQGMLKIGVVIFALGIGLRVLGFIISSLAGKKHSPSQDGSVSPTGHDAPSTPLALKENIPAPTSESAANPAPIPPFLQALPDPTDGNQMAAMEAQLEAAISQLAQTPNLLAKLTAPPWGWHPAEVREQPSAGDARRLVVTKLGQLLGARQKRLMDVSFRMRLADDGTAWDRDFGRPTSVLRVEFSLPGEKALDGSRRWNYGVTVGRTAPGRFLVWEWGQ